MCMSRERNGTSKSTESRPEEMQLIPDAAEKPANKPVNELFSIMHLFLRDELQMPSFS